MQTLCQNWADLMPTSGGPLGGIGGPGSGGGPGVVEIQGIVRSRDVLDSVVSRLKGVVGVHGSGGSQGV